MTVKVVFQTILKMLSWRQIKKNERKKQKQKHKRKKQFKVDI